MRFLAPLAFLVALCAITGLGWLVVEAMNRGDPLEMAGWLAVWLLVAAAIVAGAHRLAVRRGQRGRPRDPAEPEPQHIP